MLKLWRRYAPTVRLIGILIIVALVAIVVYQVYYFYSDKVGFTPTKAIEAYFDALAQGNYAEVYRLTSKTYLTDIYGRRITEGEFTEQLKKLGGGHRLPFRNLEITRVGEYEGARFYRLKLHSNVGGTAGTSRLLIEVRKENNTWVVVYPFAIMLQG